MTVQVAPPGGQIVNYCTQDPVEDLVDDLVEDICSTFLTFSKNSK